MGKVWGKRISLERRRGVWFGYIKFEMSVIYPCEIVAWAICQTNCPEARKVA